MKLAFWMGIMAGSLKSRLKCATRAYEWVSIFWTTEIKFSAVTRENLEIGRLIRLIQKILCAHTHDGKWLSQGAEWVTFLDRGKIFAWNWKKYFSIEKMFLTFLFLDCGIFWTITNLIWSNKWRVPRNWKCSRTLLAAIDARQIWRQTHCANQSNLASMGFMDKMRKTVRTAGKCCGKF